MLRRNTVYFKIEELCPIIGMSVCSMKSDCFFAESTHIFEALLQASFNAFVRKKSGLVCLSTRVEVFRKRREIVACRNLRRDNNVRDVFGRYKRRRQRFRRQGHWEYGRAHFGQTPSRYIFHYNDGAAVRSCYTASIQRKLCRWKAITVCIWWDSKDNSVDSFH